MKLLFDEMLSRKLALAVADEFPDSLSVHDVDLANTPDGAIWHYARAAGMTVFTKDADFRQLALLHGPPPKVVLLVVPNCTTRAIADLIRRRQHDLRAFWENPEAALLELF